MSCKTSGIDGRLSSNFKDLSSIHILTIVHGQPTSLHISPKYSHLSASVAQRKKSMTIWHSPVKKFFSVSSDSNHSISVALFLHKMHVHYFNEQTATFHVGSVQYPMCFLTLGLLQMDMCC
jgi:hypothetical protein